MGENLSIDKIIEIMSDNNNYYVETGKGKNKNQTNSGIALKLLLELSEEELNVVLNNQNVINTIMSINDTAVLRAVFRKVPAFFQEKMFENERVQDCLISPRPLLDRKKLARIYNMENITFDYNEIRELENFLHTIKSPKIQEQIIENKFFQRIIALCSYKQIREPFFRGLDVVKLFHNITQDKDIYDTRKPRKRNIIRAFNDASNHILLPDDYYRVLKQTDFMAGKKRKFQNCDKIIVDKKTLSIMTPNMIKKLLEYDNIDMKLIVEFLKNDILTSLQDANYNFELLFLHLIREQHNRNRNRGNYYFLQEEHPFFNEVDYVYFRVILEECEKDEELKKRFVDFIYKTLCNNADLDDREKESIKNTLYMKMRTNGISKEDYKILFYQSDITKTIFYLKFGFTAFRMDYLHGIKPEQMLRINTKHINQIKSAIKIENEDELSNIYSFAIFPVNVPGALLAMGDIHATMGDGECTGTGIEIGGRSTVRVRVIKNFKLNWPVLETKDEWYVLTNGSTSDLCLDRGYEELHRLLMNAYGWDATDTAIYMSVQARIVCSQATMIGDESGNTFRTGAPKILTKPRLVPAE